MAIGAFGILNRIQMLFVMIVMGITMGMQPITGYNYGAQHFDRVKRTLKLGITAGCIITTLGFIIGELFPGVFVGMFTDNHELTDEATLALRIGILSFPVVGAQMTSLSSFSPSERPGFPSSCLFPASCSSFFRDWLFSHPSMAWKVYGSACRYPMPWPLPWQL